MPSTALTVAEAAEKIGCRISTLIRAIQAGELTAARQPDGSFTIEPAEIDRRRAQWDIAPEDRRRHSDLAPERKPLKV